MKTAKLQLQADVKGFKQSIEEAKKAVQGLGSADIPADTGEKLKKMFGDDLRRKQKAVESGITQVTKELTKMSGAGKEAFDPEKFGNATVKLNQYREMLKDINNTMDSLSGKSLPTPSGNLPTPSGGGILGKMGGMGRILGAGAAALGVRSAFNRRTRMAQERMDTMQVTTDAQGLQEEESQFGFETQERRRRAARIAQQGGALSGAQVESLTDISEQVQRAFGVTEEQSAGAIGAARRAGVEDQGKFLADSIGAAQAAGLEGSKIGEFLQAQTGYLEEMSKGINVDDKSLRGFAGALGTLPFFKNDPNRIFDALRSMDSAFKGGDRFQQAQATRAILASAPGQDPASTEFRRRMGLFGELGETDPKTGRNQTLENLRASGVDTSAFEVSGGDIVKNIFDEIMATTQGMDPNAQLFEFMERTGLEAGASAEIFGGLKTGTLDVGGLQKKLQEATMSPEERLQKTMGSLEGQVLDLNATMSKIGDQIAANISEPFIKLGNKIDELIAALGGDTSDIGAGVGTAAAVAGGAAALGGGKLLGKGAGAIGKGMKGAGKGAARIAKATQKGGVKGGAKAMSRMGKAGTKALAKGAGKGLGRLVPGVGLAMFGKDAWDIYQKYERGEEITPKDWTVLTTSGIAGFAGLLPGVGTAVAAGATAASVGAEFLPEDIGMDTTGAGATGTKMGASTPTGTPPPKGAAPPMPTDKMPSNVIDIDQARQQKSQGQKMDMGGFKMPSIDFGSNNAALAQNTTAIAQLTAALQRGGGRGRSGGINPNSVRTGKGF